MRDLTDDILIDYIEKTLPESKADAVELHLVECDSCRQRYNQLFLLTRNIQDTFKNPSEKQIPMDLEMAVFSDIRAISRKRERYKLILNLTAISAAVVVILTVLFSILNGLSKSQLPHSKETTQKKVQKQVLSLAAPKSVKKGYLKGDVNHDGKVDIIDAQLIQMSLLGEWQIPDIEQADVNGDGVVDIRDVQAIVRDILNGVE